MFVGQPYATKQFFDSNGDPLSGGLIYTYAAGTTTPQATYTDHTGGTPNANPVVLDSRGEAKIYMDASLEYYVVVKNSSGVQQRTEDRIGQRDGVTIVNDIATLRTITPTNGRCIDIKYHTSAAAGGGGRFRGVTNATAGTYTHNNGTIVVINGGDGSHAWIAVDDNIDVKKFGAIGDGVADDTIPFQSAINFCAINNIKLHAIGVFKITNTLTIYSGTTIEGTGEWAFPASYGPTFATTINFIPDSIKDLFVFGDNPNIGVTPGFYTKIGLRNLIIVGNGDATSQYGLNLEKVIYSNFSNLSITGFKWPIRLFNTINNKLDSLFLTGTQACIRYSGGSATTDCWTECSFFGSPIGIQVVGNTIGIRFVNCLFEQLDNYGADITKDTENMSFVNCYSEDVPYANNANGCMFRVGLDGSTLVVENHLNVIGGTYHGRNAGTAGDFMSIDYSNGVIVSGVCASRYTNIFKGTANTRNNSIVCFGLAGIGFSNIYSGTPGKLTGIYPNGVINSGTNDQNGDFAALNVSGRVTTSEVNFGEDDLSVYDEYTAPSANCTGAYDASAIWTATKIGNKVTLTLPAVSDTLASGGQAFFVFGESLPVSFYPAGNTACNCIVDDGGIRYIGFILVLATGQIRVYRSIDASTVFAGAGGLPYRTSLSWHI